MNNRYRSNGEEVKTTKDSRYTPHTNRKGKLDAEAIALKIIRRFGPHREDFMTIRKGREGELHWKWNGNIWKPITFDRYSRIILDFLPFGSKTARAVKNVIDMLSCLTHVKEPDEIRWQHAVRFKGKTIQITVQNGVVNFRDGEVKLIEAVRDDLVTKELPFEYDPKATCPAFFEILNNTLPNEEDQLMLQCFLGYCFIPDHRFQCVLFCHGKPNSGKSALISSGVGAMFGAELMSRVSLEKICSDKPEETKLFRETLVNLGTELDSRQLKNSAIFNQIASGEPIDNAYKYEGASRLESICKHIFIGNYLPYWERSRSDAQARRIKILHFANIFTMLTTNRELEKRVAFEGAGIFNWALQGLVKVLELNEIPFGSVQSKTYAKQFKKHNNPLGTFVQEFFEFGNDAMIASRDFREMFRFWCNREGVETKMVEPATYLKQDYPGLLIKNKRWPSRWEGRPMATIFGITLNKGAGQALLKEMEEERKL